ncbi:hypothetical protein ON010_g13654 [Phytophthora cinnamomi]|nr:hypothetical protein ON010_g13654 [Phytophthora cinnamomi]
MEQNPAARAQSLQLLKSKLRTSSRRRSKSSRIAATLEELTPNQQEEAKLSQQFARRRHEQRLQERKLSESEAVEGTNIPDAATSTIESNSNQEDISVAELKKEFSKLVTKPPMALVHQPEELVALSRATPAPFPMKLKSYTKTVIQWSCDTCKRECIPVREESRCLWYNFALSTDLYSRRAPLQGAPEQRRQSAREVSSRVPRVCVHFVQVFVQELLLRRGRRSLDPAMPLQTQAHGPRPGHQASVGLQLRPPVERAPAAPRREALRPAAVATGAVPGTGAQRRAADRLGGLSTEPAALTHLNFTDPATSTELTVR